MSFISPEYVIFFAVVVPLFFVVPHGGRWLLLLLSSYTFYAFGSAQYLPLIIFSTLVDYIAARVIDRTESTLQRRLFLLLSLAVNLGILFSFKYFNFVSDAIAAISRSAPLTFDVILPVGISFYTFQSMSYTIDVYRGQIKPEKHFGIMATFVAFFPQLVAGPIERAGHLLPQFHIVQRFDVERAISGFRQILWGFFKKVVIADRLAIYVNTVYNDVGSYSGAPLIVATVFFAFQIYCDFSAYSDIAIGTARIMGFDLMENFRQPYFSQSVREFWARWHISLSTWFRDYVYIPLGGNRVSFGRNLLNLFIVFLVSGLWHGAGWTFIIWGALHGLYVVAEAAWRGLTRRNQAGMLAQTSGSGGVFIKTLWTFVLVCFAWIFFRANTIDDAFYVIANLFRGYEGSLTAPLSEGLLGADVEFALACALIAFLMGVEWFIARTGLDALFALQRPAIRWAMYYGLGAAVMFSGLYGLGAQQFIYFQF